jgi:hypothetical protein
VNWVLDADFRDYFSSLDHRWLERFVGHRIGDRRVLRLIQRWLAAGVIEEGSWTAFEEGVPQGASVSPLLANVYLHYVFDLWADQWRRRRARGDVVITRFADDFVVGFEHRSDAERFWSDLLKRRDRPIPQQGRWLASVLRGHANYYGVPGNQRALYAFRSEAVRHWLMALRRRSQRTRLTWARMQRLRNRWLPFLQVTHPWPDARFDARTQGRSPVR